MNFEFTKNYSKRTGYRFNFNEDKLPEYIQFKQWLATKENFSDYQLAIILFQSFEDISRESVKALTKLGRVKVNQAKVEALEKPDDSLFKEYKLEMSNHFEMIQNIEDWLFDLIQKDRSILIEDYRIKNDYQIIDEFTWKKNYERINTEKIYRLIDKLYINPNAQYYIIQLFANYPNIKEKYLIYVIKMCFRIDNIDKIINECKNESIDVFIPSYYNLLNSTIINE